MTKAVFQMHPLLNPISRPLAVAAIMVVLALSIGGALAERLEQRAAEDRLSVGVVAETLAIN
jgi:hypothetical protein